MRDPKGRRDRATMLPASIKEPLREHLRGVKVLHEADLAEGFGAVALPGALERKLPSAPKEWVWQWVFPAATRWRDEATGEQSRHHQA